MTVASKYPKSITKEAINALPPTAYEGKIEVIDYPADVERAVSALSREKILGFDTESRPAFKKGEHHPIALLQLCGSETAYLFRLKNIGLSKDLIGILANPQIKKVGVAIHDDLKGLKKISPFNPEGFVELADLAKKMELTNLGLRSLAAIFLERKISKSAKLSNWEKPELDLQQRIYAATDAWIGRELYLFFEKELGKYIS